HAAGGGSDVNGEARRRGQPRGGSKAGPRGRALGGRGRAKQGQEPTARHIVHRALKPVHGVHHALQGRIEEGLGDFGVEVTDQLGIPFEVGKQYGDLLALTLHGAAGRENLLSEIGRRVGERGRGVRRLGGGGRRARTR